MCRFLPYCRIQSGQNAPSDFAASLNLERRHDFEEMRRACDRVRAQKFASYLVPWKAFLFRKNSSCLLDDSIRVPDDMIPRHNYGASMVLPYASHLLAFLTCKNLTKGYGYLELMIPRTNGAWIF